MAKNSAVDSAEARQMIIDAVAPKLREAEYSASVRGPFATAVLLQDGNYKNKTVMPENELLFKGMRQGQRSAFLFEFEPVDALEFKQVEFEEKKVFLAMPEFERALVSALGFYEDETWAQAKHKFVIARRAEAEAEKELAEIEQKAKNAEDPSWGIF